MGKALSYCGQVTHDRSRDRFLAALFIPAAKRESFFAALALDAELEQVRHAVSEELLAHMRYAWWEESFDALYAGQPARAHPVLEAIAPLIDAGYLPQVALLPLFESYRNHYPDVPPERNRYVDKIVEILLRALCPQAEKGWRRASRIIARHRYIFGDKAGGWLHFKLLMAGIF